MKYLLVLCLFGSVSCAPKYTASFQDYSRKPVNDPAVITAQQMIIGDTAVITKKLPAAVIASSVNNQTDFTFEPPRTIAPDTVPARQDGSVLKSETVNVRSQRTDPASNFNPRKNKFATVGLILAIVSFFPLLGIFIAPIAIASSIVGLNSEKSKRAMAGLVLGCFAVLIGFMWWQAWMSWSVGY